MHKTLKNRISLVLLALFISMKLLGLHMLIHDEGHEHLVHCNLCEQLILGEHYNPVLLSHTTEFKSLSAQLPAIAQVFDCFSFSFCDTFIANPLFSRPPPVQS